MEILSEISFKIFKVFRTLGKILNRQDNLKLSSQIAS